MSMPVYKWAEKKIQSLTIYKWVLCKVGDPANITQLKTNIVFENRHVKIPVYKRVKPVYKWAEMKTGTNIYTPIAKHHRTSHQHIVSCSYVSPACTDLLTCLTRCILTFINHT